MSRSSQFPAPRPFPGFTLVEILLVVVIIAIAGVLVFPMIGGTATSQLRSAAQILAGDLEFAQAESMIRGDDPRLVIFDIDDNSYRLAARSDPDTPISNPVGGEPYVTQFGAGRAATVGRVRIKELELESGDRVGFGRHGQLDQTTPARIVLECDGHTLTIEIHPLTGEIAVK